LAFGEQVVSGEDGGKIKNNGYQATEFEYRFGLGRYYETISGNENDPLTTSRVDSQNEG
jgi:hypothetical protein